MIPLSCKDNRRKEFLVTFLSTILLATKYAYSCVESCRKRGHMQQMNDIVKLICPINRWKIFTPESIEIVSSMSIIRTSPIVMESSVTIDTTSAGNYNLVHWYFT